MFSYANVSTKFGEDWSNSKKWQPCFEIQDDGGHHFELRILRLFKTPMCSKLKL